MTQIAGNRFFFSHNSVSFKTINAESPLNLFAVLHLTIPFIADLFEKSSIYRTTIYRNMIVHGGLSLLFLFFKVKFTFY